MGIVDYAELTRSVNHRFLEYGCGVEAHDMFHGGFCPAVLEHLAKSNAMEFSSSLRISWQAVANTQPE